MIKETVIDESLNRLLAHFKNRVTARPPASAAELAELEEVAGPLPRDVTIFFATCNGLRLQLENGHIDTHICCLHEIEKILGDGTTPAAASSLLLVRGDPTDIGDWVVLDRGPAYGCVIRWNQWTPGAALLSSSFGRYFQSWVDYLTECFDGNAHWCRDRAAIQFDAAFIIKRDHEAARLKRSAEIQTWLHELDLVAPSGADFE